MNESRPASAAFPPTMVLVGTAQTLPPLIAQLRAIGVVTGGGPGSAIVGAVVVGPAGLPNSGAQGSTLDGVELLGGLSLLGPIAVERKASVALVSLPSAEGALLARVSAAVSAAGLVERSVPPLAELIGTDAPCAHNTHMDPGQVPSNIRPRLDLSTLIGREPFTLDGDLVRPMLQGRRVLITGAGGSIGSELARIAAGFDPALLVVMDRSENAVFEIDRQLRERHPGLALRAALHDVTEAEGTHELLDQLRPDVVFHAAAHKHVPLMEDHPYQAVRNNLFGTKAVADAAAAVGADRFVLISTDKAVRPSSVMGATKRLAELYIQDLHAQLRAPGRTSGGAHRGRLMRCSMVRFGNVLGSAASVLQIWSAQLADGGPITVTDPRMTRYFMTIHEAATLVVQAAAMSDAGDATAAVNVLDMGEPVRILDLARRFVRAHGFEPVAVGPTLSEQPPAVNLRDDRPVVEIVCTGARPGEKLHEELAYAAEHLAPTSHPGIRAWRPSGGVESHRVDVAAMIAELSSMGPRPARGRVVEALGTYVPELAGAVRKAV